MPARLEEARLRAFGSHLLAKCAPQARDVRVERLRRRRRRRSVPQIWSIRASWETTSFACKSRMARSARGFCPPRSRSTPSRNATTGPRMPNSSPLRSPPPATSPPPVVSALRAGRCKRLLPFSAGSQPAHPILAAAVTARDRTTRGVEYDRFGEEDSGSRHDRRRRDAGTAGVATASDGAVRPDDRAIHGTGAVALERSDRVVRPHDIRADRRIAPAVASRRDPVLRPGDRANRLLPGGGVTTTRIVGFAAGHDLRLVRRRDRRGLRARTRARRWRDPRNGVATPKGRRRRMRRLEQREGRPTARRRQEHVVADAFNCAPWTRIGGARRETGGAR